MQQDDVVEADAVRPGGLAFIEVGLLPWGKAVVAGVHVATDLIVFGALKCLPLFSESMMHWT